MKLPRSQECKEERHDECDGTIPRAFDEPHDLTCACQCHDTKDERFMWPKIRTTLTKPQ